MENTHLPHQHDLNAERIFDHMPAPEAFAGAAEMFRLMSDGTRIRLFWLLCQIFFGQSPILEVVADLSWYASYIFLYLLIRGFGTGAMHVVCGMVVAVGLFFLWDRVWLRTIGAFALLCVVIRLHAIFNILVNQTGPVFWIGSAIPLTLVTVILLFFRNRIDLS